MSKVKVNVGGHFEGYADVIIDSDKPLSEPEAMKITAEAVKNALGKEVNRFMIFCRSGSAEFGEEVSSDIHWHCVVLTEMSIEKRPREYEL